MRILICGPVSLHLLRDLVEVGERAMPVGYEYPLAAYLARLLHARGHEVAVVTSSAQTKTTEVWQRERFTVYHTPRRRYYRFTLDAYAMERQCMLEAIREFAPDVIHAQWTYEFAHVAMDSGYPALVTARDAPWTILRHTRTPYRLYRALYAHYVIPRIVRMSAISKYVAEKIQEEYGYKSAIELIPNGLSKSLFALPAPRIDSCMPSSFVSVSGWGPRKNVKTLLRAFKQVRCQVPGQD
jgi:glycosyltransferase involved in cell wall biosynthesis